MADKTFIGEYCGNDKHQHITIYKNIEIIFFAIVENNSKNICMPVEKSF